MINSVLRYAGGKARALKQIFPRLPKEWSRFIEPMVGGGSVFLTAAQTYENKQWWINDAFRDLIMFWRVVQDRTQCETLVCNLKHYKTLWDQSNYCKWAFDRLKTRELKLCGLDNEVMSDWLYEAFRFFYINRCSFSGSTMSGGFSPMAADHRFTRESIDKLALLPDILDGVMITNQDVIDVLDRVDDRDFVFLDPPYYTASGLYGDKGSLHNNFDHAALAEKLKTCRGKFLLTYDDCPEVRSLYDGFKIEEFKLQYSMVKAKSGRRRQGNEVFIQNY